MAQDKKSDPRTRALPDRDGEPELPDRDKDLSTDPDIKEALLDLYKDIEKGFEAQQERANDQMDYWEIYNCKLGGNQYYQGNSKIFLPIVHDAINARVTRFTNQIFPQTGRYVEVTTEDGIIPHAEMSLLEYYVRKAKLRTEVVPALCRNGDVEGQYNIYVSWQEHKRHVAWRVQKPIQLADANDTMDDIAEETLAEGRPHFEVLADSDVLVLPHTADSIEDAFAAGGSVTILRRWSKHKIKRMIANGEINEEEGDILYTELNKEKSIQYSDKARTMVDAAGIKTSGAGRYALVYETWTELVVDDGDEEARRLCRVYFGSEKSILSCKRNPYWSDKCPLFSAPVEKVQGVFKGKSKVHPTKEVQYSANDFINMGQDSGMFSMMPIVLTDPERNPRIGSMVLSLAAVWECDPASTQFAKFPDIWKSGFEIVGQCRAQIMQTLSVSPAAITQSQGQRSKPSQADVAREQQVDILTTADAVTVIEEGILTPIVNFALELDHQYRKDKLLIRQFGEKGLRAKMDWVPPIQMDNKRAYRWFGVEQARNQQQVQMQIAGLNIIKSIPPQMMPGHRIDLVPLITHLAENLFGPRLAPLTFRDEKAELTLDPELENQWLLQGLDLAIHPMDDDATHLKSHQQAMGMSNGDPQGNVRAHMQRHMAQIQMKQQAQLAQQVQQMMGPQQQGPPGRQPRAGAQPRPPRGGQQPPGMIPRDTIGPLSGAPPALRQRGM